MASQGSRLAAGFTALCVISSVAVVFLFRFVKVAPLLQTIGRGSQQWYLLMGKHNGKARTTGSKVGHALVNSAKKVQNISCNLTSNISKPFC